MTPRILIVDDEPHARSRLRELLADEAVAIAGEADNGTAAIEACGVHDIDIVLLDIRMPGIDGLETAQRLNALPRPPAVIFLTAYDDKAIEAFDTGAVDYLLKPVRAERLHRALERVRQRFSGLARTEPQPPRRHFMVRRGADVRRIPVDDVRCLRAEDKYVVVLTAGGTHLIEESLAAIEREFGERFLRIHRNCLVAPEHMRALERDGAGNERLWVDGLDQPLYVSRRNAPLVRARLRQ